MSEYFIAENRLRNFSNNRWTRTLEVLGLSDVQRVEDYNYSSQHRASGWLMTKEQFALFVSMTTRANYGHETLATYEDMYGFRNRRNGVKFMHSDYAIHLPNNGQGYTYTNINPTFDASMMEYRNEILEPVDGRGNRHTLFTKGWARTIASCEGDRNSLYIYQHAVMQNTDGTTPECNQVLPESVLGVRFPFRLKGFSPSNQQAVFSVVDNGVTIAQVYVGARNHVTITVLFPIPMIEECPGGAMIYHQILRKVVEHFNQKDELGIEKFIDVRMGALKKLVEDTRILASTNENRAKAAQDVFFAALKNRKETAEKLAVCEQGLANIDTEKFNKELAELKSIRGIKSVTFSARSNQIVFATEMLYCTNPQTGAIHEIGEFDIKVNTQAELTQAIIWNNKTRKPNGKNAPHINENGVAYLGNLADMLPEILGAGDLNIIAQIGIQFVESVNMDDPWGKSITDFPVKENNNVGTAPVEAAAA